MALTVQQENIFKDEVSRLKAKIMFKVNSLYAGLLISTNIHVKDMATGLAYTDGVDIYIDHSFWERIDYEHRVFVVFHEMFHILLTHGKRIMDMPNIDGSLYNVAGDYVINLLVEDLMSRQLGFSNKVATTYLYDEKYKGMSTEEVYQDIKKDPNIKRISAGNGLGDDVRPADKEALDIKSTEIKNIITDKGTSNIPSSIADEVGAFNKPSVVNWKAALHSYCNKFYPSGKSYSRNNRRMAWTKKVVLKGKKVEKKIGNLLIFFDVSGSVSVEEVRCLMSEVRFIHSMMKPDMTRLVTFNTGIVETFDFSDAEEVPMKLNIGGGTNIQACTDYANNLRNDSMNNPDMMIIMSDFYSPPWSKPKDATLIALSIQNDKPDTPQADLTIIYQ